MLANSASSGVSAQIQDGAASGAGSRLVPGASGGSSAARGSDVGPVWVPMVLEVLVRRFPGGSVLLPKFWCGSRGSSVWFHVAVASLKVDKCSLAAVICCWGYHLV